ncbi:hypothetical protein FGO68_gene1573 [Halteria grandinella]|uniref:endopeptidase La n=1 Tax=Halteria grandinella TaxID=5974 RepID=A0A8J8P0L8_HALGN|nr:hypothetical protein FGO68_gene1573 [Halteria grandinella]
MLLTCLSLPQYINTYKFLINISRHQVQEVFQESDLSERLDKMNDLFADFVNKLEIWNKLEEQYDFRADQAKTQKKLEEIYESLKKHFTNEKDEKQEQVKEFLKNLEGKVVPEHIMKVINEEIQRFLTMEKHHSEVQVSRTYLDYLTKMPYGLSAPENFDIKLAKETLDNSHYGMDDVKKRILEFIAVGKLRNTVQGKILCFVGPPGVGKTSIGESIATSLGRKFHRIALGGDRDTSTLKGFRRTYVGAVPGKIVRALKSVEVENPVLLIDEVDKIGQRSVHGDPGSALLEILDPEQNSAFTDDFLDVPIDLSKVLFLCTANSLDTLHPALLDRMEIIHVAGYTHSEKRHILNNYLLPTAIKNTGLLNASETPYTITEKVKDYIIQNYCREPGVRSLKKLVNKVAEKIAFEIVDKQESGEKVENITVDVDTIEKYIGHPIFKSNKFYGLLPPPGVVIGLAYNDYGGSILYIESTQSSHFNEGRGEVKVTGQLGDVMKESTMIAQTFAKNFLNKHFSYDENVTRYLETHNLHIHFPEGAVKKDGPSAGITITSAMISLALGKSVPQDIAMTGEISLNGKVLAIGGVKEKTMAAAREGVSKLIFPKANERDVNDLPAYIKEGLQFYFVEDYQDVFKVLFPEVKIQQ